MFSFLKKKNTEVPLPAFEIRIMTDEDAQQVLAVHYDAVHVTAAPYYDRERLDRWSPELHDDSVKDFLANPDKEVRVVAVENGQILGFGCVVLGLHELRACYVSPSHERKGVGSALVRKIEDIALENDVKELKLSSSLNAEDFYKKNGYESISKGHHVLRGDLTLPCVYMRKTLG